MAREGLLKSGPRRRIKDHELVGKGPAGSAPVPSASCPAPASGILDIVLHRRSGLLSVLPRDVEGQPEGREHPEQYQQEEPDAEAREGQASHERYSTRRDFGTGITSWACPHQFWYRSKPRQGFGEGGARRYSVLPCGLDEPHQQIEPAQQDARLNGQREQPRFPEHDQQQEPAARE